MISEVPARNAKASFTTSITKCFQLKFFMFYSLIPPRETEILLIDFDLDLDLRLRLLERPRLLYLAMLFDAIYA